MYLKERYNKAFTSFIIFQFIILIFFIYFPMNSHFNDFRDFYLQMQTDIFDKILQKKQYDLLEKAMSYAIMNDPVQELSYTDPAHYEELFSNLISDPYEIDSVVLLDENKQIKYKSVQRMFHITPEFLNSKFIHDAIENINYDAKIVRDGNQYFIVAVTPVVKSTARFTPYGVFVLVQEFNQGFINQKITAFMDSDLKYEIRFEANSKLSGFQTAIPIKSFDDEVIGSVILSSTNHFFKNINAFFLKIIVIGMGLLFAFFMVISKFISNKFARRIESLHSEVENSVKHSFNYEIQVSGNDEISSLAKAFNEMSKTMRDHVVQIYETNEKLHDTYLEIIQGLITAIEVKDPYTKGHSHRVMVYSEMIAHKMRYPDLETLKMAALLHDIGKIGVPETILNKAGRLTDEEYQIVKAHPDHGYRILSNIEGFNRVKDIIRYHHERIDGKGYPCGMRDIVIPLESRIIAVADTFDAITSDRAYRKGMTAEEALAELQHVKGAQLDALIVDTFVEIARENDNFKSLLMLHQNQESSSVADFPGTAGEAS